jgi:hypothetical protein
MYVAHPAQNQLKTSSDPFFNLKAQQQLKDGSSSKERKGSIL